MDKIVCVDGLLIHVAERGTDSSCLIKLEYAWLLRSTNILFYSITGRTMETLRDHHDSYRNIPVFRYISAPIVYLMPEQCQIIYTAFIPTRPVYAYSRVQFMMNIFGNVQNISPVPVAARSKAGMSNWGSPEGHMGHICVVMRATHDN